MGDWELPQAPDGIVCTEQRISRLPRRPQDGDERSTYPTDVIPVLEGSWRWRWIVDSDGVIGEETAINYLYCYGGRDIVACVSLRDAVRIRQNLAIATG
jgi:hypothetical protein